MPQRITDNRSQECEASQKFKPGDHNEHLCIRPRDHDADDLHLCRCGHFWYARVPRPGEYGYLCTREDLAGGDP